MSKERIFGEMAYGPSTSSVEWKIRDYFKAPQEVDRFLNSPTFNFCGSTWYLSLYPNGESKHESEGWILLYVIKKHPESSKHQMQYRLGILRRDGSEVKAVGSNSLFDGADRGFGWKYLKVSDLNLELGELVPEGVLTVFCTVSVNTSRGVTAAVQTERPPDGKAKMTRCLNKLLKEDWNEVVQFISSGLVGKGIECKGDMDEIMKNCCNNFDDCKEILDDFYNKRISEGGNGKGGSGDQEKLNCRNCILDIYAECQMKAGMLGK